MTLISTMLKLLVNKVGQVNSRGKILYRGLDFSSIFGVPFSTAKCFNSDKLNVNGVDGCICTFHPQRPSKGLGDAALVRIKMASNDKVSNARTS